MGELYDSLHEIRLHARAFPGTLRAYAEHHPETPWPWWVAIEDHSGMYAMAYSTKALTLGSIREELSPISDSRIEFMAAENMERRHYSATGELSAEERAWLGLDEDGGLLTQPLPAVLPPRCKWDGVVAVEPMTPPQARATATFERLDVRNTGIAAMQVDAERTLRRTLREWPTCKEGGDVTVAWVTRGDGAIFARWRCTCSGGGAK